MFENTQAPNTFATQEDQRKRAAMAQQLMQHAQSAPAATGSAGTTNIASSALAGALSGYMQRKPAAQAQPNIWAPGFDGAAGGWTGQH